MTVITIFTVIITITTIRIMTLIIMAVIMVVAMNNHINNYYCCALGHHRPSSNRTFLMFKRTKFKVPLESGASPTFNQLFLVSLSTF